jgi:hypothetical protein
MYAAAQGWAANWGDAGAIPIATFVRAGLQHASRQSLSERVRGGNDVLFYRHFHGPLFNYLLAVIARLHLSERATRTWMLAVPAATLAVIYFGCWPVGTGAMASLLFLSSYSVLGSTELAPHQLFALCALASLVVLMKAVATGQRRYWYGAVAAAALAFCTLEIALVLVVTLAICCYLQRAPWQVDVPFVAKSSGIFGATVLVIWPAAILRLSFVKIYAVLFYQAVARESAWGRVGFVETWRGRFLHSPFEWMLIVAGALMLLGNRRWRRLYPVGLFAALMIAATLRVFTDTPRYSLAFVPALDLLAGLTLGPSLGPLRRPASLAVVALAVAALYGNACYQVSRQPRNPNPRSTAVLTYIHQNELENKRVLAPQADLPTLHYYFPGLRLRGYLGREPTMFERVGFSEAAIIPAAEP